MADVLVLGDGIAGLAAAITLRQQGKDILLTGRRGKPVNTRAGESLTSSALFPIRQLDLTGDFFADEHEACYGNCSSWGNDKLSVSDFIQSSTGQAWYIDRTKFHIMLETKARAMGADVLEQTGMGTLQKQDSCWAYHTGDTRIDAKIVIDATGRSGWLARQLDIKKSTKDKQVAVIAILPAPLQSQLQAHSMVEAVYDGWWYAANAGNRAVCIFFTDPDLHQRVDLTDPDYWASKIKTTVFIKHRASVESSRLIRPLELASAANSNLSQYAGESWLAAGDAACAMDPLSSHGIAFALRSGIDAGLAAAAKLEGDPSALNGYDQQLSSAVSSYNQQRTAIYRQEMRWPNSPYWQRRHLEPGE